GRADTPEAQVPKAAAAKEAGAAGAGLTTSRVATAAVGMPTRPRTRPFVDLEVSGVLATATAAGQTLLAGGGALRLAAGWRFIGLEMGAAGLSPSRLALGDAGAARLLRFPFDVGARLQQRWPLLDLVFDIGVALTVVRVDRVDRMVPGPT